MIDSHCHLNDKMYEQDLEEVIADVFSSGIDKVICVGADYLSSVKAGEIASTHENIYYTIGVHPDDCNNYSESEIEDLIVNANKKLVAIGEIGLDYFHNKGNRFRQIETFESQINLAIKHNLPIVVHCREAYGDCLEVLKRFAPLKIGAVFHCYSGSIEFARELLKLGVKFSFTGSVTFNNAKNIQEVAKNLPIDSFFFETDSPYLTPTPYRGERNSPKNVFEVAKFVANLRGMDVNELIKITDQNAKNFFKIK